MSKLFKGKLQGYDVHLKTIEGVNQQTLLGAILTIVSTCCVFLLIYSATTQYLQKEVVSRMITDVNQSKNFIKIALDIEFPFVPCDMISYTQEITRGSLHVHDDGQIQKTPLVSVNSTEPSSSCRVFGETITDKVGGVIKFVYDHPTVPDDAEQLPFDPPNFSHKINHIMFLPVNSKIAEESEIPGIHNPLNGQQSEVPLGTGIYQYAMQIVPTQYSSLNNVISRANQYSVTERQVKIMDALRGVVITNQSYRDFLGILITYDFYPVRLVMEERKENIFDFIANLCGIVGGVLTVLMYVSPLDLIFRDNITLLNAITDPNKADHPSARACRLIERCLHQSTKALIGKSD